MAPVAATVTGVQRQTIDDPKLVALLERLRTYDRVISPSNLALTDCDDENLDSPQIVDIEGLVGELERWPQWRFQELADLYEWIGPLNAMDAALSQLMSDNPAILLISSTIDCTDDGDRLKAPNQAESELEANSVPPSVLHATATILRFLSNLLKNATNKQVFNSVRELNDLLAAADDTIASLALEALSSLAMLPIAHRHQTPEAQPPTTAMHTDSPRGIHARLMTLAKGWGSRGSGLGLADCVIADDSDSGQGALPSYAGEVRYEFLPLSSSKSLTVHLSTHDITSTTIATDHQQEKRRKMTGYSITGGPTTHPSKSTAHLFFQALQQIGGRSKITTERSFALLVHIRLAASFHSQQTRIAAVERRLHALLAALYAHQSHDVLVGYFYAQQELCGELADLIRPTVSSSAVSSSGSSISRRKTGVRRRNVEEHRKQGAIAAIVDTSSGIPYNIRSLAVEVLTALVARSDDSNANVSQVARQSNVLAELGVGKGQFLGLLPTLMRYSLASLNAFLSPGNIGFCGEETDTPMDIDTDDEGRKPMSEDEKQPSNLKKTDSDTDLDLGLDLGLTFLEATKSPPLERRELEEKALEFIDLVLSLVSAVISFPSGTAALTDCGLVPALVSTVALDSHFVRIGGASPFATEECRMKGEESYADSLLKFIIAQAIQILEGALSTHGPALSAFYDLKGSDLLVTRLHVEIEGIRNSCQTCSGSDIEMAGDKIVGTDARPLKAARRALLFSIVTCLTVVFHRQETSSRTASSTLSAGMQLQKPEMTNAFIDIMDNVWSYGGAMAALTCTLLSHIMNADPQVVHYVHKSGLAESFLRMIKGTTIEGTSWFEPNIPPSPDLIMALPNVISALALTEDGAKIILKANPIQELLGILCGQKYAMPQTRCLLNEMPGFIGSGLDEIMRYVPSLKRTTMKTIVASISMLVTIGKDLFQQENKVNHEFRCERPTNVDNSRTRFIQYTHNIGQVLEQVLQNDEHCTPFVDAGGIDEVLKLYPFLMPTGRQLLCHISCQSAPSVASLTHSTTANVLMSSVKRLAANDEPHKAILSVVRCLDIQLNGLEGRIQNLRKQEKTEKVFKTLNTKFGDKYEKLNTSGILEGIPFVVLHQLKEDNSTEEFLRHLSLFMNSILTIEWMTHVLSSVIKAAVLSGWGKSARDWEKDISSNELQSVIQRLSTLHRSSLHEVCRIRGASSFEDVDEERWKATDKSKRHPASYSLRIVCPDGAVLRDGIEIDSCSSVGSLEMGEVIRASDRCINESGIMRYRTDKGWISEQTRGCAREPVVEVLSFHGVATRPRKKSEDEEGGKVKCIECGIPDLCSVSASVLARLQNSQSSLFSSLGRVIMYGFRSLSASTDLQQGTIKEHISALVRQISHLLCLSFSTISLDSTEPLSEAGTSMYFGNMLNLLHTCLYEDKRDKQVLNVLFLCNMLLHDGVDNVLFIADNGTKVLDDGEGKKVAPTSGFLTAIRFVIKFGLSDMAQIAEKKVLKDTNQLSNRTNQRLSKAVAASFPPAISLLRRLVSKSLGIDQQIRSFLNRMKNEDLRSFLMDDVRLSLMENEDAVFSYQNFLFASVVNCSVASVALELWTNPHLTFAPPHVMNPIVSLLGETLTSLEVCSREHSNSEGSNDSAFRSLSADDRGEYLGLRGLTRNISAMNSIFGVARPSGDDDDNEEDNVPSARPVPPAPFEPSEDTVRLMMEMGFGRDHALHAIETTESNTLEIAMEYALAHPHPSPASIARRREARETRQQQQQQQQQQQETSIANANIPPPIETSNIDEGSQTNSSATARSATSDETVEPMDVEANDTTSSQDIAASSQNNSIPEQKNTENKATENKKVGRDDLSENEKKLLWKKQAGTQARILVDVSMKSIRSRIMDTAIKIIEGPQNIVGRENIPEKEGDDGNDEMVTITVVICSFLLELCERHKDERSTMVTELLRRMKSHLHIDAKGSSCSVTNGRENKFASLCHATVLFLRALPRTRPLLLKNNLISHLLQCVRGLTSKLRHRNSDVHKWPRWLSPTLLLLDVMAQPMTLRLDGQEKEISDDANGEDLSCTHTGRRGDYARVCAEHKRQGTILSKTSKRIFIAISCEGVPNDKKVAAKEKELRKGSNDEKNDIIKSSNDSAQQKSADVSSAATKERGQSGDLKSLSNIPTFMPLITQDMMDLCLSVCLHLLRCQSKLHGRNEDGKKKSNCLPPTVTHGVLLLLTRTLRSHGCASQFLKFGGAELLLSLQSMSRFQGHVRLITVLLRRMLEDETTLQTAMETEIRSTVAKLQKKQTRGPESYRTKIEARSFVQAVTPLICRDPLIFLKAAATSIRVEPPPTDSPGQQMYIVPLTAEERTKNSRALSELFRSDGVTLSNTHGNSNTGVVAKNSNSSHKRGRQLQKNKSLQVTKQIKTKSPHRHVAMKRGVSPKKVHKGRQEKLIPLNGSSSNHVTTLLLTELLKAVDLNSKSATETNLPFLCVVEYLEILADLVLAIPACAAAIHRYHPTCGKDTVPSNEIESLKHALSGCANPPRNIVSYLLHKLLPQPRSYALMDSEKSVQTIEVNETKDTKLVKKRKAYVKAKISQSTARLLVALVARAGEGRRRVISDLALALNGQGAQHNVEVNVCDDDNLQLWALQVWGELCIGLAAPRSSGVIQDSNSSLSFEVVRVMMECGMAHSLMHGISKIKLHHPLAASASAALLRPLEVFTRPSVAVTLHEMAEKEDRKTKSTGGSDGGKSTKANGKRVDRISIGASQQNEGAFVDDAMLGDGFDADTAENARLRLESDSDYENSFDDVVEERDEFSDDDDQMENNADYDEDDGIDEDENMSEDGSDHSESGESESSEETTSSANDSLEDTNDSESSEEDAFDEEMESNNEAEEDDGGQLDAEHFPENDEDTYQWDEEGNDDFFEGHGNVEEEAAESGDMSGGGDIEEGWTRIEPGPGAVGRMMAPMFSGRGTLATRTRSGGSMMEAAEAVLGNFLRAGEIEMEAIAEIENTLVRISSRRGDSDLPRIRLRAAADLPTTHRTRVTNRNNSATTQSHDPVGIFPSINQLSPPENVFSSTNFGSRINDINSMEYLYGGCPFGSDRIYYDLCHSTSQNDQPNTNQTLSVPSTLDTDLFPGGPAACTHTRPQLILHPLLSAVNLPPSNSLVSPNMSQSSESSRVRLPSAADTSWNLNSRGTSMSWNLSSRGVSLTNFERPTISSVSRDFSNWTDDGQPVDNLATDFSLAFQQTLGHTIFHDPPSQRSTTNASNNTSENSESASSQANEETQNTTSAEDIPSSSQNAESSARSSTSTDEVIAPSQVQQNDRADAVNSIDAGDAASSLAAGDALLSQNEEGHDTEEASNVQSSADGEQALLTAALRLNAQWNTQSTGSDVMNDNEMVGTASLPPPVNESADETTNAEETASEMRNEDGGSNIDCIEAPEVNDPIQEDNNLLSEANATQSAQPESNEQQPSQGNSASIDCPPGMDVEVFSQLPIDMQREVVAELGTTAQVANQLDSSSSLDPEALAALPEDMRREVIEQEQNERRLREQESAPADPSNAEDMDMVSFLATLTPDVREQVLLDLENNPDVDFGSLPPDIVAEIHLLRERASTRNRRHHDETTTGTATIDNQTRGRSSPNSDANPVSTNTGSSTSRKRNNKVGRMRVDLDRPNVVFVAPIFEDKFGPLVTIPSMKALVSIMYLLSPVRPQKLLHKLILNLCGNREMRKALIVAFVALLNDQPQNARCAISLCDKREHNVPIDDFPPSNLIGTVPDIKENDSASSGYLPHRRKNVTPVSAIAANFPVSAMGSYNDITLPPVVARRIVGTLSFLSKNATRVPLDLLYNFHDVAVSMDDGKLGSEESLKCLDVLLGLLGKSLYAQSSSNLDDLLNMIESICQPLSILSVETENEATLTKRELEAASTAGKEWIKVPRVIVSPQRLKLLCSILRLETCKDASFSKINTIARCLCKVDANRDYILRELASVAQSLGADAIRDLRSLSIRLNDAVKLHQEQLVVSQTDRKQHAFDSISAPSNSLVSGTPSSAVTLSTSSSELKLLRVLQSLHSLCGESPEEGNRKKNDVDSEELVCLLNSINLESLWGQLACCLKDVSVLEGVNDVKEVYDKKLQSNSNSNDQTRNRKKKLQNSVAGLLSRFLPTIEAFFVVNASNTGTLSSTDTLQDLSPPNESSKTCDVEALVGGRRLIEFVGENKVLLNALLRSNPSLLDKGLRAMVQVPRCRPFLDFDIKRQWFKTQVRRLRQAGRRHGSLRLSIRRQHVFEDAYHQLRLRNAEEMRGRLQITFTNEEGVDAGGLSREFFGILGREIFNPNYALFTSTEDGCTFQPNPHSSINPDHLLYFRFVGRIVGKAVVDGFLLDAHFTRSLYKHMLGVKPTHHDMQAIDPDYYKNLKMILEYNLEDIGLDLTFSTEDHSFGRSRTVDLIENGRNTNVTEENKEQYVSLVCQYRMTTAIKEQIKAYLEGFNELVKPDLISIFTAKELELLISGMPDIDVHDLKKNADYQGFKASDREIGWFWNIIFSLSRSEKAAFLQFVTGSSKVPLAGFSELQGMRGVQKFSIHKARGGNGALMSAHTCFNALDLPVYKSEEEMKAKLLYAIQEGSEGFLFA